MLRYLSAGESHGRCLTAIIEGLPAGLPLDLAQIDGELARRQRGYGRGPRMELERDRVQVLAGLRDGKTLGSPLALLIENRDWTNWEKVMDPVSVSAGEVLTNPRPGHADLPGVIKYRQQDVRNILERASARETAMRVAVGAVAKALLAHFQVQVVSHVVAIGDVTAAAVMAPHGDLSLLADESPVRCLDPEAERAMVAAIKAAQKEGDSLGESLKSSPWEFPGAWAAMSTGTGNWTAGWPRPLSASRGSRGWNSGLVLPVANFPEAASTMR